MDHEATCRIVGIGASAGGIEALKTLFGAMPSDAGLGFVLVAHLAPRRESALGEIVARFTAMEVLSAVDGMAVEPDHVYVMPPDTVLKLRRGRLQLFKEGATQHERHPIDVFLSSLADDQGERAIAIILSGAGSDGTLGIKAIKEAGGLTIAQGSASSAPRYPDMPASAIATGLVDVIAAAEEIPAKLLDYIRSFGALERLTAKDPKRGRSPGLIETRAVICAIIRARLGHDFSGYKERTFLRRVQRRMQVLQLHDVADYIDRLRGNSGEVTLLFRDLLIGVTGFFRDNAPFEALEKLVVPRLFQGKGADDTVRVWVPGCGTGEEVYSIAILMREHMDSLRTVPKVQMFATDIDEAALGVARLARYPASALDGMAPSRVGRFFVADDSTYVLSKQIRDMCVFSTHSAIRDPPFSRMNLISCRNVLIYLDAETQSRLLPVFHYALRSGGFLFLGTAENVSQRSELFVAVDKKNRIFRRRDKLHGPVQLPVYVPGVRLPTVGADGQRDAGGPPLRRAVESLVLERFAPVHVVVDSNGETIHYSPRTGKYLELPAGQPSRNILALARKGVRLELRNALRDAQQTGERAIRRNLTLELEADRVQRLDLIVEPLPDRGNQGLFLVVFEDVGPLLDAREAVAQLAAADATPLNEQLERELRETRERLQSTVEEYESALEELKSANEELVSVNEELQSTNEELETSKEEVQSINEELHTVNQELAAKVEQLNEANNDLRNLFESTRLAILFLDRRLVIRSFTPSISELFSLIPSDRGRPLGDITTHFDDPALHDDIRHVLATGEPMERQITLRDGHTHNLMRVMPYLADGQAVVGTTLTFVNITALVEAERQQRLLVHEVNHRVRNMLTLVMAMASQTIASTHSLEGFASAFSGRLESLGRAYGLVAREQWGDVILDELIRSELEPHLLAAGARIEARGPRVVLRPKAALSLGMVVHELATNAVKYGALSTARGRVLVEWRIEEQEEGRRLLLTWRETGGPAVREPETRGFGSELIQREIQHDLRGEVTTRFLAKGLRVELAIPWRDVLLQ